MHEFGVGSEFIQCPFSFTYIYSVQGVNQNEMRPDHDTGNYIPTPCK